MLTAAAQHGSLNVNLYGYSRGAIAAVNVGNAVAKAGGKVNIVGVDPVVLTHFGGGIPISPGVNSATDHFQAGHRWGITDFPGTPFAGGSNVHNIGYPDGVVDGYRVRHENMPRIIYPPR